MQLLTSLQRIPAIFLLIQNYKTEGITRHPFAAVLFEILASTPEPFEKKMISDIIIDSNREQYSLFQVETLYERQETMLTPYEDRIELKAIKQQFLINLPKISENSQSEVKNLVRDFTEKQKPIEIPEYHVNLSSIKQPELDQQAFNIGFMRPMPKFLEVEQTEFHWLSPSVYSEITWDSGCQNSKKFSKAKTLLKKAQDQHLTKDECSQVEKALDSDVAACLSMEVSPQMLRSLIKQNPFLAVAYLVKLSNYPIVGVYIESLLDCEVSVNSIDVVSKLIKSTKISTEFVSKYTSSILGKVLEMSQTNKDRQKLARIVINFVKGLKKSKYGNFQEFEGKLAKFLEEFIGIEEVQQFRKLMNKQ